MSKQFDLKRFLKDANKFRKTAVSKAASTGYDAFDDGSYVMKAVKVEIGPNQAGDRIQATTHWKFLEGEYKGKIFRAYQGLKDEAQFGFFLGDLQRMGFDIPQIDDFVADIPKIMKEVEKEQPICRVALKTNGDFQNLRIRRLMDEDEVEVEEEEEETEDEEEKEDEEEEEEKDDEEEEKEDDEPKKKGKKHDDEEEEEEEEESKDDDDEEEESEEEEVAVSVGATVRVKTKSGEQKGEIIEILESDNAVRVRTKEGKVLRLTADKILEVVETPAEPKKKGKEDKKKGKK